MIRATIVTVLLIWLNTLNSCSVDETKAQESSKFKELDLKPMTLVIDEVSCKQCVRDMAEIYAVNPALKNVVFLTADPFGRSTLELDSIVETYPRREFESEANKMGSFFINAKGDTIKLDVTNYKQVLENLGSQ